MLINVKNIWKDVRYIREKAPLVHNITNYVVMNTTANALLAIGASPVMAHAEQEVEEMVGLASALVINIGTLSERWIRSMALAMKEANRKGIPVVLDPVGAGATTYRTKTVLKLIHENQPSIIRGNASEILALVRDDAHTKGVDSTQTSVEAVDAAAQLVNRYCSVVCITGSTDIIIGRSSIVKVHNGHPLMSRVTGMGCTATAICGAFTAVNSDFFSAAVHSMVTMGIAGELAAEDAPGPGTMQVHFLDMLHNISEKDIKSRAKIDE